MELAEHITDRPGRFLELCRGRQTQFGHGIDDAPLDRLETVADVRQSPVENDVHGVIEVGLFREMAQRKLLDSFISICCFAHKLSILLQSGGDIDKLGDANPLKHKGKRGSGKRPT